MPYYALFYDVVENFADRRAVYREEHLRRVQEAHSRGELVLAGALAEPVDRALLVFRGKGPAGAESFAAGDPYVTNGLVTHWEVRPWNVVTGHEPPPREDSLSEAVIARLWSAKTTDSGSAAYLEHFSKNVLPDLRKLDGYAGSTVFFRKTGTEIEILVATGWKSLAAIRQFAGEDSETAVVADEASAVLTGFDRRVRHYELVFRDRP